MKRKNIISRYSTLAIGQRQTDRVQAVKWVDGYLPWLWPRKENRMYIVPILEWAQSHPPHKKKSKYQEYLKWRYKRGPSFVIKMEQGLVFSRPVAQIGLAGHPVGSRPSTWSLNGGEWWRWRLQLPVMCPIIHEFILPLKYCIVYSTFGQRNNNGLGGAFLVDAPNHS